MTADTAIINNMVDFAFTCLGCGKAGVASYCDECVDWPEEDDIEENIVIRMPPRNTYEAEIIILDPPPWEACPSCQGRGPCWECGAIDMPALGRKIKQLNDEDKPALLTILRGTKRQYWPLLARAYALTLGSRAPQAQEGILWLWDELMGAS